MGRLNQSRPRGRVGRGRCRLRALHHALGYLVEEAALVANEAGAKAAEAAGGLARGAWSRVRRSGRLGGHQGSVCPRFPGGKDIRTSEAAPVKRGDRRPVRQSLVVPQRQCFELVVYLPVQRFLPPTRGTTACPHIVAHIAKHGPRSQGGHSLVFY